MFISHNVYTILKSTGTSKRHTSMLISQKKSGCFYIIVSWRHCLVFMPVLEVTHIKPCFVDFLFPFIHITTGPFLVSPVHHSLTGLLVTFSHIVPCLKLFFMYLVYSSIKHTPQSWLCRSTRFCRFLSCLRHKAETLYIHFCIVGWSKH